MKLYYDMSSEQAIQSLTFDYEITTEKRNEAIAVIIAERRQKYDNKFHNIFERDKFEQGIKYFLDSIETDKLEQAVEEEFKDELTEYFEDQAHEQWEEMNY